MPCALVETALLPVTCDLCYAARCDQRILPPFSPVNFRLLSVCPYPCLLLMESGLIARSAPCLSQAPHLPSAAVLRSGAGTMPPPAPCAGHQKSAAQPAVTDAALRMRVAVVVKTRIVFVANRSHLPACRYANGVTHGVPDPRKPKNAVQSRDICRPAYSVQAPR